MTHDSLADLDELVVRLSRRQRSVGYRRELLRGLPEGLGIGGLRVLRSIERRLGGEAPTVKDVAADHGIEQSTASRAVGAVVAAGLADRSTCDDDQRKSRLSLTPAGHDVLALATRNRQAMLEAVTAEWSDDDLAQLTTRLLTLVEGLDAHLAPAPVR
jgi:DNA-binding MarR family transcriptional regulator